MTVKELINHLAGFSPDLEIVVSNDDDWEYFPVSHPVLIEVFKPLGRLAYQQNYIGNEIQSKEVLKL